MTEFIWARLLGFVLTDGCLYYGKKNNYYEVSFSVGQKEDVEELSNDLKRLGYSLRVQFQEKTMHFGERLVRMKVFRLKCTSKALFSEFVGRGAPIGDKSLQSYSVPEWIMVGSAKIKRAFLSGILGGDGSKIAMRLSTRPFKQPCNTPSINDFEFYKDQDQIKGGISFAHQLAELFSEQKIVVKSVFVKGKFPRKRGGYSSSIHISFSNSFENCINYGSIGFAYSRQKTEASDPVIRFMNRIIILRENWKKQHASALNLYNAGLSIKEVSQIIGLNYGTVFGWLREGKRPTVGYHKLKFGELNAASNNSEI